MIPSPKPSHMNQATEMPQGATTAAQHTKTSATASDARDASPGTSSTRTAQHAAAAPDATTAQHGAQDAQAPGPSWRRP